MVKIQRHSLADCKESTMRKGSKVIKIKYEEDSIFVGAAWGRKRTRWGRKGA